jgi:hypothetical protein
MRGFLFSLFALFVCLSAVSCKSNGPDITGKWTGKIEMPEADKNNPMAGMGQALGDMLLGGGLNLEFMPGDKFEMTMLGVPIAGKVQRSGLDLTLTPDTAAGMPIEDFKKGKSGFNGDPMHAKIAEDGSKITVIDKDAKTGSGGMVFVRAKEEAKKETASTVAEPERGLVGSYRAEVEGEIPNTKSEQEKKMAEAMIKSMTLDLNADNTFKMTMIFPLTGTWKSEGNSLTLHVTGALGMKSEKSDKKDDMVLNVGSDGSLTLEPTKPTDPKLHWIKK